MRFMESLKGKLKNKKSRYESAFFFFGLTIYY